MSTFEDLRLYLTSKHCRNVFVKKWDKMLIVQRCKLCLSYSVAKRTFREYHKHRPVKQPVQFENEKLQDTLRKHEKRLIFNSYLNQCGFFVGLRKFKENKRLDKFPVCIIIFQLCYHALAETLVIASCIYFSWPYTLCPQTLSVRR